MCSPSSGGKPTQVAFLVVIFHSANEDGVVVKGLFTLLHRGSIFMETMVKIDGPQSWFASLFVFPETNSKAKQNQNSKYGNFYPTVWHREPYSLSYDKP